MRLIWSTEKSPTGSAIFIDRDGVINCQKPGGYVLNWSQFVFVPGIRRALHELTLLQLPIILISNQSAVGRGWLSRADLEDMTQRMWDILQQDGTTLSAAYFCLHTPDDGCACRKPRPELLRRAAADFEVDLRRSVFIGDSETDVQAARTVGCCPVLFDASLGSRSDSEVSAKNLLVSKRVEDLFDITAVALQDARQAPGVAENRQRKLERKGNDSLPKSV